MLNINTIKNRIVNRDFTVGIIGIGYVGLGLAIKFGEAGFRVIGFDLDQAKINNINNGSSYIQHIPSDRIFNLIRAGQLKATNDFNELRKVDASLICVQTPLTRQHDPDLQFIVETADAIVKNLKAGQLVCLESTTYPGTTEEILLPHLITSGLKVGEDFFLAFSPEREDPGNEQYKLENTPKVVSGITPACLEIASLLYAQVVRCVVRVSSTRVAEAAKLLENIYRAVNIALVNELKITFDSMGIDIWEVIEAAKTKPFGFQPFYPGPGLGGHCIPIDPFYLAWKAREYGITTRFVELAGEINNTMPLYVIQKLADALNMRKKSINGSKILVLGIAYKKDVGDLRGSPSVEILELLLAKGAQVDYSDPYFPNLLLTRHSKIQLESISITEESIQFYDAILIVTDHSSFPYEMIYKSPALIVDSRNALRQRGFAGFNVIGA
ncbi:MAG: UDP-N-acetyl-D-glucosamine 6-dehydrogenase [Pelotomaculum sp. PtaU1.Bin035]|nr:MAG: UDP-N-acetyl-D-glucosamine 6-dehydrogenase [Pelotomaculum sp. PtaU1.Bin035]